MDIAAAVNGIAYAPEERSESWHRGRVSVWPMHRDKEILTPRQPEKPWLIRTYAGHSTAEASNELYRNNLTKGQTGLSVAFDLPTQTGYDPDDVLSRGEVGKVGVPISNIGGMRSLFEGIPLAQMNTSMTINAGAMFMLAMYQVVAEEQAAAEGIDITQAVASLRGTTQNDIIKEYLSRGTYAFPRIPRCG